MVWRPQTALFSSKPSDRKQPRRTHIKKAKPQPAVDVAKLLEQLFSQRRPATAPPAGKARTAKPPPTSSMMVSTSHPPPKTEPSVSVFPAASSFKQVDADSVSTVTVPATSGSSPTSTTPASSKAAAIECQTSAETIETKVETATEPAELSTATVLPLSAHMVEKNVETSSFSAATVETTVESPVEPVLSPVETLEVRAAVAEGPVEPAVDVAEDVQTKGTDSGVVDVSHNAKENPLIETTVESPVKARHFPVETLETRAAVVEASVEPTIDVTIDASAQKVETKSIDSGLADISHTAIVESSLETTVEPSVEASKHMETHESRTAVVECAVEPTVDATVDTQAEQTNITDPVNVSHTAEEEPLIETTIDASVEASTSFLETLEIRAAVAEGSVETTIEVEVNTAAQAAQTNSTHGEVNISYSAKEEPLIQTTIEPAVEFSTSTIETEAADNLSHTALIQNAQQSAPLSLKIESSAESTVESRSVNVAVEEEVSRSEEMTLDSVTLHEDKILVASLQTDELLQTKSILDGKADKQLQELSVQTEIEHKAETENSSEGEILSDVLSKWDSLSEDLRELEGQSGTLVTELLCRVPAVLFKTPGTSSASDPPVGANGEQTEEKETEAEAMTLESMTLAKVKAEVGGLETKVLLETRNALEKEADVRRKEEKMEVTPAEEDDAVFEAEILTLDFISEATDALEAETSVMLEAMFGSEQGPRQPPDALLVDQKLEQQDEVTVLESEKESEEQEGSVLEAMSLESVTLAEVEASLGTLESLSETTDYLEKEAEFVAGEKRVEVEDMVASKETTEAPEMESLSLPEVDVLSEDLQIDALMEELLFSVPGPVTEGTEGSIDQEVVRVNILNATVATGSAGVNTAPAVTDDFRYSPALNEEVLQGQQKEKEEAEIEASGSKDSTVTHADLDPVQRLFLEKIKEYNNMRRLNGGLLEAEPDYEKYLSEETAKLQRLYGGGDLNSFPQFTFTEPDMDQDSK